MVNDEIRSIVAVSFFYRPGLTAWLYGLAADAALLYERQRLHMKTLLGKGRFDYLHFMKISLLLVSFFLFNRILSQDSLKIKRIDKIVSGIEAQRLQKVKTESNRYQDTPDPSKPIIVNGYYTADYYVDSLKELKKVVCRKLEDSTREQFITISYYDKRSLIKAIAYIVSDDGRSTTGSNEYYYNNMGTILKKESFSFGKRLDVALFSLGRNYSGQFYR